MSSTKNINFDKIVDAAKSGVEYNFQNPSDHHHGSRHFVNSVSGHEDHSQVDSGSDLIKSYEKSSHNEEKVPQPHKISANIHQRKDNPQGTYDEA